MKKLLVLALVLLIASPCFGAVGVKNSSGSLLGTATDIQLGAGVTTSTFDGSTVTILANASGAVAAITSGTIAGTTINSSVIGGSAPRAGTFTALTSTTSAGAVSILTPGATPSLDPTLGNVFTLTPAQHETINAASVISGQTISIVVTTSGSSSYTLTFGTSFKSTGTLATGVSSGKVFTVTFVSDGTNYNEVARTTAM